MTCGNDNIINEKKFRFVLPLLETFVVYNEQKNPLILTTGTKFSIIIINIIIITESVLELQFIILMEKFLILNHSPQERISLMRLKNHSSKILTNSTQFTTILTNTNTNKTI
jgi:hypothetical protein